jgi:undecaprenyl phosphate-alpha-L-ara4FN deformylase
LSIALKIDVDTYRGLAEGANRLAVFLRAKKIPASFFVTLGSDTSGWAALRVFRRRGFLQKMNRTGALSVYGWRTALSGTLLPARPMANSFKEDLRRWQEWGFEVSPHGYDHIRWHDQAAAWDEPRAAREWTALKDIYVSIFGRAPKSFAAPGWQAGAGTWSAMDKEALLYHSDSRGSCPYFPATDGSAFQTLEIPTTMPTWDEMLAGEAMTPEKMADETLRTVQAGRLNVWTVHAEFEGGPYFEWFKTVVEGFAQKGETWDDLRQVAARSLENRAAVPVCHFEQTTRPGRAGTVTCQTREWTANDGRTPT